MKIILSAFCAIVFGLILLISPNTVEARSARLLGARECTWGPSYWCSNITNAKNCNAVRHCIQTVWEKQNVPEDHDSVCDICLDMVKQARDQLKSNQTQEDLKAVFEGSCKLIPLRPAQKECIKLADNFIPELIEALASQMNPQVVCSVAGLCNNAEIDKQLAAMEMTTTETPQIKDDSASTQDPSSTVAAAVQGQFSCSNCNIIGKIISDKFQSANRDDIAENMLRICGKFSSFSDACSNIVLSYFNEIYDELKQSMNPDAICHMSGACVAKYHNHPEMVEIRPMSNVGVIPVRDDLPCELCEQLVKHLRELLVANTTEEEFKSVLEGLCKQTKGFEKECLSIVDQYYDEIYQTLVHNLDANGACFLIGVCPKDLKDDVKDRPIMPLLPSFPTAKIEVTIKEKPKKKLLGENEPMLTIEEIQNAQLPIDRLLGAQQPELLVENGQLCTLCEYILHFAQEALSAPKNEEKIKEIVSTTCNKMPTTIRGECHNFVDMYGDAVIALLIQGMDPSQVCPMLKMCPEHVNDMEVFAPNPIDVSIVAKSKDKPTCPLCLFAVQQAQEMIKSDKSVENVKNALDHLCVHLPKNLQDECVDFVNTYSDELIRMLIDDFTAQQICVYVHLCADTKPDLSELNIHVDSGEDIMTNEIPDNTINGHPIHVADKEYIATPECLICQRIIKDVEKRIVNKKSRAQIKHALEHACEKMHKAKQKCLDYVDKYEDKIIDLIMKDLPPKAICRALELCLTRDTEDLTNEFSDDTINGHPPPTPECLFCQHIIKEVWKEVRHKSREEIKHELEKECEKIENKMKRKCLDFVDKYEDKIIDFIMRDYPQTAICRALELCLIRDTEDLDLDEAITIDVVAIPSNHPIFKSDKLTGLDDIVSTQPAVSDGPQCVLCEFIMAKLESELSDKKTQDEIKHTVLNICHVMPKTVATNCKKFIDQYADLVLNLIDTVPPKEICTSLQLCAPFLEKITDEVIECGVCHGAVVGLYPTIKSKLGAEFKSQELIDEGCDSLPAKYHSKCSELITYYGKSIINLISFGTDKEEICSQIGKCFRQEHSGLAFVKLTNENNKLKRNRRQLLGAEKCTWGPSYWCSDEGKAKECEATQYCTEKVWGKQ